MSDTRANKDAPTPGASGEGAASSPAAGTKPAGDLTREQESGMSEDEGVDTVKQDDIAGGVTGRSKDAGNGSDDQDFDLNAED